MELNKENLEIFQREMNILSELQQKLRDKKTAFDAENKELIENIASKMNETDVNKMQLKTEALNDFEATGEKKLLGGLGIRQGTSLRYDEKVVLEWAKKHDLCLQLDRKEFEKLAKTQDINGVIKEEKVTVTFPKKIEFKD